MSCPHVSCRVLASCVSSVLFVSFLHVTSLVVSSCRLSLCVVYSCLHVARVCVFVSCLPVSCPRVSDIFMSHLRVFMSCRRLRVVSSSCPPVVFSCRIFLAKFCDMCQHSGSWCLSGLTGTDQNATHQILPIPKGADHMAAVGRVRFGETIHEVHELSAPPKQRCVLKRRKEHHYLSMSCEKSPYGAPCE